MSQKQTPSEFLKQIIGRPVVVKLNSGMDYRGILVVLLLLTLSFLANIYFIFL